MSDPYAWNDTALHLPADGRNVEWITPAGFLKRGLFTSGGSWVEPGGARTWYVPRKWRYLPEEADTDVMPAR